MIMENLETPRLRFRQWQSNDFPFFADYFSDEEQTKYLGGTKTKEQAWRLMASYIGHYQLRGYSYLAVVEKASDQLIGTAGLWESDPWPEMELGYWFHRNAQGKGMATEAANAVKDFALHDLKRPTLVSFIDPENTASIRLAKRLGGKREMDIALLNFGVHQVYRYGDP